MGLAAIAGISSGALHAIAGPDHVLSLAPLSVGRKRGAWRIGLLWGLGHALGTAAAAVILFLAVSAADLHGVDSWAEGIAGLALIGMGIWGLVRRHRAHRGCEGAITGRSICTVGLIHGCTGAAALLMLLPAAVAESDLVRLVFLGGFSLGSTLAMAGLTAAMAAMAARRGSLGALLRGRLPALASVGSMALGSFWIAGAL
ncbi:hypothetical protein [Vulgatibacter sp.]|uniref:hypothetical protein n=1 Tax=Vulgatibacter sp. TaxID=1971226 RepID=UPI0035680591